MNNLEKNIKAFCSWSGGKDCCFALFQAMEKGYDICSLLCMLTEDKYRSRSHGLSKDLIELQAGSLQIPIEFGAATWNDYEDVFLEILEKLHKNEFYHGVFGDIDVENNRKWVETVCQKSSIEAIIPLWQIDRTKLVIEFLNHGFKAMIVAVKKDIMNESWLGCTLNFDTIEKFQSLGIDISGENGEYHTFVYDGPIFKKPINLGKKEIIESNGYLFLNIYAK
ncbi:MAG: diphthine--ammonia ligase [bacterium]